ncbi:hypothetical protein ACLOJK_023285, partial [Asimina triloba]
LLSITVVVARTTHQANLPSHREGLDARQHHLAPAIVPTMSKHDQEARHTPTADGSLGEEISGSCLQRITS